MSNRLASIPPFGLLARVLGADSQNLIDVSRVTLDTRPLLQFIALATLAADRAQIDLSKDDQELLRAYFAGEAPDQFEVDEQLYLEVNPDVAASVAQDPTRTAKAHFLAYGLADGRAPNLATRPLFANWLSGNVVKWAKVLPVSNEVGTVLDREIAILAKKTFVPFMQGLETLPYFRAPTTNQHRTQFVSRLVEKAKTLQARERITVVTWLAANRDHDCVEAFLPEVMKIDDEQILPSAVKAMVEYGADTGKLLAQRDELLGRFLASRTLKAFLNGKIDAFADGLVRGHAAELAAHFMPSSFARLPITTRSAPAEELEARRHVFVGFFGQMRFPEDTLPALIARVRQACPEALVTVGISTWDRSSVRKLEDLDPVYFATEQLPPAFTAFSEQAALANGRDFCGVFPALGAHLRARSQAMLNVTHEGLEALIGQEILSDIAADEVFTNGPAKAIAGAFPDQSFMLNQGRMWNRIAALGPLMDEAIARNGPVTDVLIMRPDIKIGGDLATLFQDLHAHPDEPQVFVDYDAHATYLNGVGDRLFLTTPDIARRLFDGERIMQTVLADETVLLEVYRWFLVAHRYPQSLLFQHGARIRNADHELIRMTIYRGQLDWVDIIDAVQSDRHNSPDPQARAMLSGMCPPSSSAPCSNQTIAVGQAENPEEPAEASSMSTPSRTKKPKNVGAGTRQPGLGSPPETGVEPSNPEPTNN